MAKTNLTIAISGTYNGAALEKARQDLEKMRIRAVSEMGGAGSALVDFGAKAAEVGGGIHNLGYKMESLGNAATTGITLPIAAAAVAVGKAAVDMDTSLTNVKKTVDGTDSQYQALKKSAIDFSKTNAVSASQIMDLQSLGAQLGYSIDELDEFGRVVSGLDIATNMDAETAGTELAQFANITKMAHGYTSNYASTIVGLGNNMATTESDISSMAMRLAAAGTQVGMSQADILGLAAALSSMGVEAEAGGTAISTIMSRIDKDVATGSENLELWASTAGMTAAEFSAAWKNDPVKALGSVLSGMDRATLAGGNMSVMLEELGISSVRQTDIMKRLAGNSDLVTQAVSLANEEWTKNTALQAEVDNRNDSLAARFQILQNRVAAVAESVGTPLVNALLGVLEASEPLLDSIGKAAQAFADMNEADQQMILGLVGAVAAFGPVTKVAGGLTQGIGDLVVGIGKGAQHLGLLKNELSAVQGVTTLAGGEFGQAQGPVLSFGQAVQALGGEKLPILSRGLGLLGGALKAVPWMLAIGFALQLIDAFRQWAEREATVREATLGLADAMREMNSAAAESVEGIEEASASMGDLIEKADAATEAQARLAGEMKDAWGEVNANASLVDKYVGQIEELAGKSNLSASEQAKLQSAVDGFNSVTGESLSVTDALNGELSMQADAIRDTAEAYKDRERSQTASEQLVDVQRELAQIEQDNAEIAKALAKHEGQVAASMENASDAVDPLSADYAALTKRMQENDERAKSLKSTEAQLETQIASSSKKYSTLAGAVKAAGGSMDSFKNLTEQQLDELKSAFDGSLSSIESKLKEFGYSLNKGVGGATLEYVGGVADAASEMVAGLGETAQEAAEAATKALQKELDAQYKAVQKSMDRQYKAVQKELDAEYDAASKSYDNQYKAYQKQLDAQADALKKSHTEAQKSFQKELDAEYEALKDSNERKYKAVQSRLDAEYDALKKSLDKQQDQVSKALSAQENALKKSQEKKLSDYKSELDAEYKKRKSTLDAEYDAVKTAYSKELDALKKSNASKLEEVKAANKKQVDDFKAATDSRIAEMKREHEAQLKALGAEEDSRIAAIDSKIAAINAEADAEKQARERAEQEQRLTELQKAVNTAESAEERQRAETALSEYVDQLAREQRERERAAAIAKLEEEKKAVKAETSAREEGLKASYEKQLENYKQSRETELEAIKLANEAQQAELAAAHTAQEEALKESQAAKLATLKESHEAQLLALKESQEGRLSALKEAQAVELEALKEAHTTRLEAVKESHSKQLESLKSSQTAQLEELKSSHAAQESALKEAQTARLDAMKEAHAAEENALKEAHSAQLEAMKEGQQEQLKALKEAHSDQLEALKESQSEELEAIKEANELQLEAARKGAKNTVDAADAEFKELPTKAGQSGNDTSDAIKRAFEAGCDPIRLAAQAIGLDVGEEFGKVPKDAKDAGDKATTMLRSQLDYGKFDVFMASKKLRESADDGLEGTSKDFRNKGEYGAKNYKWGINSVSAYMDANNLASSARRGLEAVSTYNTGQEFSRGFTRGANSVDVRTAAWNIGIDALNSIRSALGIASPSKEAAKVGRWFGLGAIEGMDSTVSDIKSEAAKMSDAMALNPVLPDLSTPVVAAVEPAMRQHPQEEALLPLGLQQQHGSTVNVTVHVGNMTVSQKEDARAFADELALQIERELASQL